MLQEVKLPSFGTFNISGYSHYRKDLVYGDLILHTGKTAIYINNKHDHRAIYKRPLSPLEYTTKFPHYHYPARIYPHSSESYFPLLIDHLNTIVNLHPQVLLSCDFNSWSHE